MDTRRFMALALLGVLTMGVVSASSLGGANAVTFAAAADTREPCLVDQVQFLSGGSVLGSLLDLRLVDVDQVGLDLDPGGDCSGLRPILVVYGDPDVLDGVPETVALSRTELPVLVDASDVVLPIADASDELNALIDLSDDPTQVRVAFCPMGVTTCEP